MTDHDPILAKVRKLLALAEDPAATAHEAETYTAKAAQLIADYGIDRALLASADPGSDPVGDRVVTLEPPYAADKMDLLTTVAGRLRCRAIRRTRWTDDRRELSVHLFGHGSDLERVELLFTSLLLQATTALARTPVPSWENKAAFRRSWLEGFRHAVGDRLWEAERRACEESSDRFRAAGTSTALVLADRTAEVDAVVQETYPDLTTARPRQLSGSGRRAGWAAGRRADLGERRVGGVRRSLGPGG
jgi:hypothetical protein